MSNYQATIHSGTVIKTARFSEIINIKPNKKIVNDNNNDIKCLRSGDIAKVRFTFYLMGIY